MRILNFGSVNIDHVYRVTNFVRPGETISAQEYAQFMGGKGLNQSVALARAGAHVIHAGMVGPEADHIIRFLKENGVDCSLLKQGSDLVTGHAVIQVSAEGENSIVLFGGANRCITQELIREAVAEMQKGDFLLLQNEISMMPEIISAAADAGLRIFFNPAPMNESVLNYPLERVDTFIVNRIEAAELAGLPEENADPEKVMKSLRTKYPKADILMTLGSEGAFWQSRSGDTLKVPACKAEKVVDTTAAGDTFIGYFLASLASGEPIRTGLEMAVKASAITVSRAGASSSIPFLKELPK